MAVAVVADVVVAVTGVVERKLAVVAECRLLFVDQAEMGYHEVASWRRLSWRRRRTWFSR